MSLLTFVCILLSFREESTDRFLFNGTVPTPDPVIVPVPVTWRGHSERFSEQEDWSPSWEPLQRREELGWYWGVEIETNSGMSIVCREEATKLNTIVDSTNSADFFIWIRISQRVTMERARTIFVTPLPLTGMIFLLTYRKFNQVLKIR